MSSDSTYLDQAIKLAFDNVEQGGRPFGAVVVKGGKVIATGVNRMQADCDPTAHAELLALRAAGKTLQSPRLDGCEVYASGQPCPMCFAAMRMAGVKKIRFAYSNEQAEPFGLSTAKIAVELAKPLSAQTGISFEHSPPENDPELYQVWESKKKTGA
ncbi:nucleoside deaminase [Brucella anthropi]|jgi:tRNA(Arg) A34 adenosine deaminase TadA|uniref:Nucleoside deaminase n=1 Tax=Brucella anthropi TaxID=529 RepID=A0A6I0DQM6_BRUAN|nr:MULTISPECIES: nucleoside deaminase [Brucella/Ochrobactrum group]MCR5941882.1 nucleoside deaminase [Ochrobactrum sp. XJ1]QTN03467.1 nucleoside deaminase [Ochrobactrum sp. EEELCW01]KAB2737451.1 nucleoside deaminase [Brucella anthropi]KAB2759889.1 nucleoside deaminase [Brucella anthropi]KAB2771127.1 nucleoside deaminase [Brucella anthropi]